MQRSRLRDRPEQTFFEDPAVDRLLGVILALGAETYVLRDRVARLEEALEKGGVLQPGATEAPRSPEAASRAAKDREAFVAALMENLLARQKSNGAV